MGTTDNRLKTYRYLRVAMMLVIVMLGASVLTERAEAGCFQTSISAYYYTPAQSVFIAALAAVGVCMVVLRGSAPWEDIWLNLAGILAPIVAFVPVSGIGHQCRPSATSVRDASADISNNMIALFVATGLAIIVSLVVIHFAVGLDPRGWNLQQRVGVALGAAFLLGALLWFALGRSSFEAGAHYTSAIALFVCIVLVVVINARDFARRQEQEVGPRRVPPNRYGAIAVGMIVVVVATVVAGWAGWDYWILGIETGLIALFCLFWAIQTLELWHRGTRADPAVPSARSSPPSP